MAARKKPAKRAAAKKASGAPGPRPHAWYRVVAGATAGKGARGQSFPSYSQARARAGALTKGAGARRDAVVQLYSGESAHRGGPEWITIETWHSSKDGKPRITKENPRKATRRPWVDACLAMAVRRGPVPAARLEGSQAAWWALPERARAAKVRKLASSPNRSQRAAAVALCRAELARRARARAKRKENPDPDAQALHEYKRTHWGETGNERVRAARAPDPTDGTLTELGALHSVVYVTQKGGDREDTEYEHAFDEGDEPTLAFNRSGGLVIVGGGYTVETGGITG